MCGRYSQRRSWSDLVRLYNITADQIPLNLPPRYNIAPTQDVPVVRSTREDGGRGSCRGTGGADSARSSRAAAA